MPTLLFRAPDLALDAAGLMARVLPDVDPEALLRSGALRRAFPQGRGPDGRARVEMGAPLRRPRARVAPGAIYGLEAERPYALPALGRRAAGLVPALPWLRGSVMRAEFRWEVTTSREGVSRIDFEATGEPPLQVAAIADWAQAACAPLLGDLERGGVACGGPLRLVDGADALTWPDCPVSVRGTPGAEPDLRISAETAHALRRGHPWVLPDADTDDAGRFERGALVRLRVGDEPPVALAHVEAAPRLVARVWARGARGEQDPRSIEDRVVTAVARRAELIDAVDSEAGTDAFRLVHGEADGLPGLAIDRFGPGLRVFVAGAAALPIRERAWRAAARALGLAGGAPVVEVLGLRDAPPGRTECVRVIDGVWPEEWSTGPVVRERGMAFRTDLGLAEPDRPRPGVGFFTDQRENRERVAARVRPGGRYANLFAHTGAFSAALLAAGAGDVVSVDLSARYLAWLEENLERSGLAGPAHVSVQRDVRQWLLEQRGAAPFDGVILDPPTAAAAGRRYWSVQKEMRPLLVGIIERLAPGGFLLLTRNEQRGRKPLRAVLERASREAARALSRCEAAPPGIDHPSLAGFAEGEAFEGVLATFD